MKTMRQSGWMVVAAMSLVFGLQAAGQQSVATVRTPNVVAVKREIVVSLEDRKLALVEDGKVMKVYRVGTTVRLRSRHVIELSNSSDPGQYRQR